MMEIAWSLRFLAMTAVACIVLQPGTGCRPAYANQLSMWVFARTQMHFALWTEMPEAS